MNESEILKKRHDEILWPDLKPNTTALLLIDLQQGCTSRQFGSCSRLMKLEGGQAIVDYYINRIKNSVIPAVQRLQQYFRTINSEVIFVRIQSLTTDGRDRSLQYIKLGIHFPPGSPETKILNEIKPLPNEMVFSKTSTSAFNSTNLCYVLHNIGIETLVVCGVISSGCVELNVRDASDLSFNVIVVEDACAAWSDIMHTDAMNRIATSYGIVCNSNELIGTENGI